MDAMAFPRGGHHAFRTAVNFRLRGSRIQSSLDAAIRPRSPESVCVAAVRWS